MLVSCRQRHGTIMIGDDISVTHATFVEQEPLQHTALLTCLAPTLYDAPIDPNPR
jgi:hypothetical protein